LSNQIKKGLLLSLPKKKKLKINKHSAKNTVVTDKKVDCDVHFLRLSAVWWPGARETTTFFLVLNFAKYSPI